MSPIPAVAPTAMDRYQAIGRALSAAPNVLRWARYTSRLHPDLCRVGYCWVVVMDPAPGSENDLQGLLTERAFDTTGVEQFIEQGATAAAAEHVASPRQAHGYPRHLLA